MLVFNGVMKATKAADGTIDSWTFGCFTKSQSGCSFFCPAVGCDRYVDTETIAGFSKLSTVGVTVSVGAVLAHRAVTTVVPGDEEKWEPYMGLFSWKYNRRAF